MGGGRVEGLARRDEAHRNTATPLVRPANIDKEAAIVGCTGANIDCSRVEMSCSVDEITCTPAIVLIIVKTLDCTRAIKGFYYDEDLSRPAMLLEGLATIDCRPATNLVGPAAGTITPNPGRPCRQVRSPAPSQKPKPAPTLDCKPP